MREQTTKLEKLRGRKQEKRAPWYNRKAEYQSPEYTFKNNLVTVDGNKINVNGNFVNGKLRKSEEIESL